MIDRVLLEALEPRLMLSADLGTVSTSLLVADDSVVDIHADLAAPLGEAPETAPEAQTASETYALGQPLSAFCDPGLDFDYLVITNEALRDASSMDYTLADFVARKEANGYATTVVTVEDIYANYTGVDNQEEIRNFIRDAYNSWGIEYVLLGGNTDVIPVRQVVNDAAGNPYIATDMYYQCLDGSWDGNGNGVWGERTDGEDWGEIDWYSEVYIGRALLSTETELSNWVYKTLDYEDKAGDAYRRNALMVGEYTGFGGTYANWGKYCMEKLVTGSSTGGFTTAGFNADPTMSNDTLYARDADWGASDILGKINTDDYGIYNHLGHGNGGIVMGANQDQFEANMTNENPFFLYSQACWSGYYLTPDSVAESLLSHTRTGAAALVLNSNYGWGVWEDGTDGSSQRLNREFWDAAFNEGIYTLGAMNADSHEDLVWNVGNQQVRSVILDTMLFGDPTLEIFSTTFGFLEDTDLPTAYEGLAYSQQLDVIYNQGNVSYALVDGALPAGITITADGLLSGTTTEIGEFDFTIEIFDAGTGDTVSELFNLTVDEVLSFDVSTTMPEAFKNATYYAPLTVSGGTGGFTWELTGGALPDGLVFDTATGVISGTATVMGEFSITVQVTDSNSYPQVISETFDLTVNNLQPGFYGQVFDDTNGNGVRDAGEIGINGHTVSLLDPVTGAAVATTVTASVDVDGNGSIDLETEQGVYAFENVAAGRYVLQQDAMPGWQATTTFQGDQRAFMLRNEGGVSTIYEIDPADMSVLASFPAPTTVGAALYGGLAVGPESLFYLDGSNVMGSAVLYELDIETGDIITSHTLANVTPALIMGIAWLDGKVYLQDAMQGILVYDVASETLEATLPVVFTAGGFTAAPDRGTLFASGNAGTILEIDPTDGSTIQTLTPYAGALDGGLAYVDGVILAAGNVLNATGEVFRIDPTTGSILTVHTTGGGATITGLGGEADPLPTVGSYRIDLTGTTAFVDMNFGATYALPADFDHDGDVDADDIDLLTANFGNAAFDLDGIGSADAADVDYLLATVFSTVRGDINLDGKVDLLDLGHLGDGYLEVDGGWASGDLNGDGVTSILDLGILGDSYGFDNTGVLALRANQASRVVLTSADLTRIDVPESEAAVPTTAGALSVEALSEASMVLSKEVALVQSSLVPTTETVAPVLLGAALSSASALTESVVELAAPIEISQMATSAVDQTADMPAEADVMLPVAARQMATTDDEEVDILLEVDLLAL